MMDGTMKQLVEALEIGLEYTIQVANELPLDEEGLANAKLDISRIEQAIAKARSVPPEDEVERLARMKQLVEALDELLSFDLMAKWSADRKGDFPAAVTRAKEALAQVHSLPPEDELEITQVDREAAADLILAYWPNSFGMQGLAKEYRAGYNGGVWADAFRRHRVATKLLDQRPKSNATSRSRRSTSPVLVQGQEEPVAWRFELATMRAGDTYTGWRAPQLSFRKPCVPEGSIRNLTPLYAHPPAPQAEAAWREAAAQACERQGREGDGVYALACADCAEVVRSTPLSQREEG